MPDPLDPILADLPTAIDQQRRNPSIAGPSWCIAGSRTLRYQYCNRAQQRHDPLRIEPLLFDKTKAAFEAYVLTKLGFKKTGQVTIIFQVSLALPTMSARFLWSGTGAHSFFARPDRRDVPQWHQEFCSDLRKSGDRDCGRRNRGDDVVWRVHRMTLLLGAGCHSWWRQRWLDGMLHLRLQSSVSWRDASRYRLGFC